MSEIELLKEIDAVPEGDWIALSSDESRLLAHHPDLQTALEEAHGKGEQDPVVMKSASTGEFFIIAVPS